LILQLLQSRMALARAVLMIRPFICSLGIMAKDWDGFQFLVGLLPGFLLSLSLGYFFILYWFQILIPLIWMLGLMIFCIGICSSNLVTTAILLLVAFEIPVWRRFILWWSGRRTWFTELSEKPFFRKLGRLINFRTTVILGLRGFGLLISAAWCVTHFYTGYLWRRQLLFCFC